jgi:CHAT domain-containing protein
LAKGLLLNSEIDFRNLIQKQENNKAVIAKYEEWRELKVEINKQYAKTDSTSIVYRKTKEEKADNLERVLLQDCKAFGDYTRNLSIRWQDVQARLGLKDVAIEYTSFPFGNDSTMYCALLLKKNSSAPILVPLFEKKELDNLTLSPNRTFSSALSYDNPENHALIYESKLLGQVVWGKILPYLTDVQNVYFSPSGVFHQLGIETLLLADGKTFSEHYTAYRLSSTRELATTNVVSSSNKADLYGGLQYNEEPQIMANMSFKNKSRDVELSDNLTMIYGDSLSLYQRAKAFYGVKTDSINSSRAALEVNELPFTKEEVADINTELKKSGANNTKNIIHPIVFTGTEGNEESFKALSGTSPKIIHIATHGFFLPQSKAEENNDKRSFLMGFKEQQQKADVDFSLSRSGLLMAGARKAWMGETIPDSIDDGILTAREIAHLDLRGTDLVVLSACETGLGDVTGEGVFGLQRGFKKAGVNTLVMSLWKVDDKATKMMMTQFYGNLMKGQTKRAAFLNAQKYLKDYTIQEKQEVKITAAADMYQGKKEDLQEQQGKIEIIHPYASPQFWAAFIMLDGIK